MLLFQTLSPQAHLMGGEGGGEIVSVFDRPTPGGDPRLDRVALRVVPTIIEGGCDAVDAIAG